MQVPTLKKCCFRASRRLGEVQGRLSDTAVADVALASVAATAEGASPWVLAVSAGRGGGAPFLSFHRLALGTSQVVLPFLCLASILHWRSLPHCPFHSPFQPRGSNEILRVGLKNFLDDPSAADLEWFLPQDPGSDVPSLVACRQQGRVVAVYELDATASPSEVRDTAELSFKVHAPLCAAS